MTSFIPSPDALTADLVVTTQPCQHLEGFGASGAWWAQAVGQHSDVRETVLDLLFHPERGIGLTVYRHNLGGGKSTAPDLWRRAETLEVASGTYDWTRDAAAISCLQGAVARGARNVVLFSNTPLARMTLSGSADGHPTGESNLPQEHEQEFARFLVDVTQHFLDQLALPSVWLSPINEPQWDWKPAKGQEGCHYTPEECARLARTLLSELAARGEQRVQLSLIDSATWLGAAPYLQALLEVPEVQGAMRHYSVHSYFNDAVQKAQALSELRVLAPELPLWMSEWTEMREGRDDGMVSALTLARTVHEDLTLCNVTSWQAWIAVSKYEYCDGLIYVNDAGKDPQPTKRLWAFGQYSKFIRPGATRVDTTALPDLLASAFLSQDQNTLHVVLVNDGPERPVRLKLPEAFADGAAQLVVTDETRDLQEIWVGHLTDLPEVTLSAGSVSTLIVSRGGGRAHGA